jgi:hypothetical protein
VSLTAAAIEVVRGELDDERAAEVLEFWASRGALEGDVARERLPKVVCIAADDAGEVVGVNSVDQQVIPLVGRPFWLYRRLLAEESDDLADAMFNSAFQALAEEFEAGEAGPIGVCTVVDDRAVMERRPEAIWPQTDLLFAGYLPGDRQLRIRYFWGATAEPSDSSSRSIDQMAARDLQRDYQAGDRFRIEPFGESSSVTTDDVFALWAREGVVADAAARERIEQVHLVALADDELVGVSTLYLERHPRLGMQLWHYRTFVSSAHRQSMLAAQLYLRNLELLEARFLSGEDTRAQGIVFDLENDQLMKGLNSAVWPLTKTTFIGDSPMGAQIRVRYFPGARVPPPAP